MNKITNISNGGLASMKKPLEGDHARSYFIAAVIIVSIIFILYFFKPVILFLLLIVGLPILWLISGVYGLIFIIGGTYDISTKGMVSRKKYLKIVLGIVLFWAFIYVGYYVWTHGIL